MQVIIHYNGSVDFCSDENWFGIENITIRATDPSGALVEDIITVTVLPVNDAPVIGQIPDQEGLRGETWILDIKSYLSYTTLSGYLSYFLQITALCIGETNPAQEFLSN